MLVPGSVSVTIDRFRFPPYGVAGGRPGLSGGLVVNPDGPDERRLTMGSGVPLAEGDVVSHRLAGGGGFGDPRERPVDLVVDDVRVELISAEQAREVYGVALRPGSLDPDEEATQRLRGEGQP